MCPTSPSPHTRSRWRPHPAGPHHARLHYCISGSPSRAFAPVTHRHLSLIWTFITFPFLSAPDTHCYSRLPWTINHGGTSQRRGQIAVHHQPSRCAPSSVSHQPHRAARDALSLHFKSPGLSRSVKVQSHPHRIYTHVHAHDLTSHADVILSPFKPQRKNVGGDDVASSLYYIHLDTPGDDLLAPRGQRPEDQPRASLESVRSEHRIARKPLPVSARVPQRQVSSSETPVDNILYDEKQVKFPPLSQPVHHNEISPVDDDTLPPNPFLQQQFEMPPPPLPVRVAPTPTPIIRKPIGPRQMSTGSVRSHNELPQPPPGVVRPATPPALDETRPPLPERPVPPPLNFDTRRPVTSFDELRTTLSPGIQSPVTPSRSPSPWSKQQKPFTPFSLTIIRRDPGTGHQWNIGKVTSYQSTIIYQDPYDPDAAPITQYPRGYPAINVHIETSGYARFRNFSAIIPKRPGSSGNGDLAQSMKELATQMKAQNSGVGTDDGEGGFNRQVVMTYGKTWTHNLKEAFRSRNRSSTNSSKNTDEMEPTVEPLHPPRASFHRRQESNGSTNSNESTSYFPPNDTAQGYHSHAADTTTMEEPHPLIITQPGPGLRPKGYTFTSPWDGRCDFRTSSNGRALKCSHTRNTTSQGFNPLVAAQAIRDAASSNDGRGRGRTRGMSASISNVVAGDLGNKVPVSELRFNLPSTDLFNSKEDRERAAKELAEGFSRLLVRSPGGHDRERGDEIDDEDGEEPIFDFSGLGRERAGGGNRGKRAKLGKLLVHDEGIKMLDLTVATNMGIWWQAWERSF